MRSAIEMVKIILCMIVRNESKIITRCLDAAIKICDAICICDTGSTDETISIIESYIKEKKLTGKVVRDQWRNFGHNRTMSFKVAKEYAKDLKFDLTTTYGLLLDADMVLELTNDFKKNDLKLDSYQIIQYTSSISYLNTRFVCMKKDWTCIGVTHEFWSADNLISGNLYTVKIDDRNDGGCKSDKFERDIKLLTDGLRDEPNNGRYMFYLAQSYMCIGKHDNAIEWYRKRIDTGGWDEEVWYSFFQIAECYSAKKDWDSALKWYLAAIGRRCTRAEPIYRIAHYYREKGENHLAVAFAKMGLQIPYPQDSLFIEDGVYQYKFHEELSIAAYYTPFKPDGYKACDRLILSYVPDHVRYQAFGNLFFYLQPLEGTTKLKIEFETPLIEEGKKERYRLTNPSIIARKKDYLVVCRSVNYDQVRCCYTIHSTDQVIRTKNFVLQMDDKLKIVDKWEIIENIKWKKCASRIVNFEDMRLFTVGDRLWFTCTSVEVIEGLPRIVLGRLAKEPDNKTKTWHVEFSIPVNTGDNKRCEKNWNPICHPSEIQAVYTYGPGKVISIDEQGEIKTIAEVNQKCNAKDFRGGGITGYKDGYLSIIHEVIFRDNTRYYTHRFITLDKQYNITRVTRSFIFDHVGIEFAAGICVKDDKVTITSGSEDCNAFIWQLSTSVLESMLQNV